MGRDRWQEFDEVLEDLSGGTYKFADGSEWIDEKHGPIMYHEPPIYVADEFEAYVVSTNGEVPSALKDNEPVRNACESWGELVKGIKEHECAYSQYIPFDEPRRLCLGFMCSQCGETWMMRISALRASQSKEMPNLLKMAGHPFARRQVGIFIREGENSPNLAEGWGAYLAGKTDKPGVGFETQEDTE